LIGRGTPFASLEAWRVASPTTTDIKPKAGFIHSMNYTHPWFENTTEEELKALFDEIRETLPELNIDDIVLDQD
jgi:hypothetical protein